MDWTASWMAGWLTDCLTSLLASDAARVHFPDVPYIVLSGLIYVCIFHTNAIHMYTHKKNE